VTERARCWREFQPQRVIHCGDGHVLAREGQIVLVAVVDSWPEAARLIENLEQKPEKP
jgi:hypothetical protein